MLLLVLFALFLVHQFWWRRRGYPPGPTPLPIIGNLHSFWGVERQENKLYEWKQKYGPIFTYWISGAPVVNICDHKLMREHIVNDGDTFADRPFLVHFDNAVRGGVFGIIDTSGDLWREQRRFVLRFFRDFGVGKNQMEERILEEIQTMCERVNEDIQAGVELHDFYQKSDVAIGSLITAIVCGFRLTTDGREDQFRKLKALTEEAGRNLADPFRIFLFVAPFVRKFPFCRQRFEQAVGVTNKIFDFLDGESSSHTVSWAIAYAITNPEAQAKLHEELDRVIGSGRSVTRSDKTNLPFANAFVMETQRMANILSLNAPRFTTRDVEIAGCVIKKARALVIPQISVPMIDPQVFPEPQRFNPDRFIDERGQLKRVDEFTPFSLGKRQCPGESLARME
ncbi:hypothetical protein M3Y99_00467000 [Aphelenchoides fujianensis]|nr:hypothetical protein M3Y99_00467000 [Aphelenchoides fujianensis]